MRYNIPSLLWHSIPRDKSKILGFGCLVDKDSYWLVVV